MRKASHHKTRSKPTTRAHGTNLGGFAGLILLGVFLVAGLGTGCAGVTTVNTQGANPPQQLYKISGTLAPATAGSGATVTLSGATTATITADSSGNYAFVGIAAGSYAVTPSKAGYTFSPSSRSVTLSTGDATAIDFNAATVQAHSAILSWAASAGGTGVVGYDVYRSTADGGPYVLLNSSPVNGVTYTDSTVQSGQTYFYVATAVDSSGEQSIYSNQVQAVIP